MQTLDLPDEAATDALAQRVAATLGERDGLVVYLDGDLGVGKTTFTRALLRALGVTGAIKSPTYTLMESYPVGRRQAWHLDLYRIADPAELEFLGLDALVEPDALVLVEWPEHGRGALPAADVRLRLAHKGTGRTARWQAQSPRGEALLAALAA